MIGTNHSKTHIVVVVVPRIVVVPGGAAQSISFVVLQAPALRTGNHCIGPFPLGKLSFLHRLFNLFYPAAEHFSQLCNLLAPEFIRGQIDEFHLKTHAKEDP